MRPKLLAGVIAFAAALCLNACEQAQADLPAKAPAEVRAANDYAPRDSSDPRTAPIPQFKGKPIWSANRRYTAEENAAYHFERNGEAFGADTVEAYVEKAHAFVSRPPAGVQTLKRPNGDTLFYDEKANVFAVSNREGAPRTMFKPDNGPAYWARQKEIEQARASGRGREEGGA